MELLNDPNNKYERRMKKFVMKRPERSTFWLKFTSLFLNLIVIQGGLYEKV
jgi:hypothetical protein